jgi:hypothetical protein
MSERVEAATMPRLEAFDEEFGPDPSTILRPPRRRLGRWFWGLTGLLLAVGLIGAWALAWPGPDAWLLGPELQSAPVSTRTAAGEGPEEQITRLLREVADLKHEVRELTSAQQQAAETIAAFSAAATDTQGSSAHWYSDLAALSFGIVSQQDSGGTEATSRRAPAARARANDFRRRENGAPLSLEPPQN